MMMMHEALWWVESSFLKLKGWNINSDSCIRSSPRLLRRLRPAITALCCCWRGSSVASLAGGSWTKGAGKDGRTLECSHVLGELTHTTTTTTAIALMPPRRVRGDSVREEWVRDGGVEAVSWLQVKLVSWAPSWCEKTRKEVMFDMILNLNLQISDFFLMFFVNACGFVFLIN